MSELYFRIEALSNKIELLKDNSNAYQSYVDVKVKQRNLMGNYALILAKLLLQAEHAQKMTLQNLAAHIDRFNAKNNSILTLEDYLARGWVREINGSVQIPSLAHSRIDFFS